MPIKQKEDEFSEYHILTEYNLLIVNSDFKVNQIFINVDCIRCSGSRES